MFTSVNDAKNNESTAGADVSVEASYNVARSLVLILYVANSQ